MVSPKLLSVALLATTIIAAPAMARPHHVNAAHAADDTYDAAYDAYDYSPAPAPADAFAAAPDAAYGYGSYGYGYRASGYGCVAAPRVGSFAGQPWDNDVPCEPGTGPGY
ncbi:MAG TPA: hypothetical protein VMF90_03685 [Rhizobiaceae bacterium]|nr:hypothetical protein [Rhizobiaceae bacterium]